MHYQVEQSRGIVPLSVDYKVKPNQQLIEKINTLLGGRMSRITY
ncbi:DNA polymerase III alpha subunit [uncultured Candidatus Thioglobus sp.]|nr:DNA polymerase III alpha subunit [uncultured Candidatus Thioglobus sp.]